MTLFYCKETGEEATQVIMSERGTEIVCLIHGNQPQDHFEEEKDNKVCEICGRGFWVNDNIRKTCSMECAKEYGLIDKWDLSYAKGIALNMQKFFSQCSISGHKVGACLVASNQNGEVKYFGGCNIEFSTSFNIHAERVALVKAISEGYTTLHAIVVTSEKKATATMCGYCRQDYMYVKPDIMVFVINPDGTVGIEAKLIDTMKFPYVGRNNSIK